MILNGFGEVRMRKHTYFVSWINCDIQNTIGNNLFYSELRGKDLIESIIVMVQSDHPKAVVLNIQRLD